MTSPSPAAERQRRYRERRRRGVCIVPVEVDGEMIGALVRRGHLEEELPWDPKEVGRHVTQIVREALVRRRSQGR